MQMWLAHLHHLNPVVHVPNTIIPACYIMNTKQYGVWADWPKQKNSLNAP
jgi:hypothetical protein